MSNQGNDATSSGGKLNIAAAMERAKAEYVRRTPGSAAIHKAACKYLPSGETRATAYFEPYPVVMQTGMGCHVKDVDGNSYLDSRNNFTSLIHGHADPQITCAVVEQLKKGTAYAAVTENQVRLAEILCTRVPALELVRFRNSGTEATMLAIRVAKAYTGRNKILKMEGGYHGSHDAVEISVSPPVDGAGPARRASRRNSSR